MSEMYPYTNYHNLNMDWIIKIAKDFLDQYTHIQETITEGLGDITNTKDDAVAELERLQTEITAALNGWYDEHSADIATELEDALADLNSWFQAHSGYLNTELATNIAAFNSAADAKAATTIASIPDDYTTFFDAAIQFRGPIPSNYTYLKQIHAPGIYYIGADNAMTDKPLEIETAGIGAQLVVTKLAGPITRQDYISAQGKTRTRLIKNSDNSYYTAGIRADTNGWFLLDDEWHGTANTSDFSSLISHMVKFGWYYIGGSAAFTDRPTELETGLGASVYVEPFGGALVKQTFFNGDGSHRCRIVNSSTYNFTTASLVTDANGWFMDKGVNVFRGLLAGASYSGKMAKVTYPSIFYVSSASQVTDAPDDLIDGLGAMLTTEDYASTLTKQTYFDAQGHTRERIIKKSDQTPYTSGRIVDGNGWSNPAYDARYDNRSMVAFGDSRTWYDGKQYTSNTKPALVGTTCVGYQHHVQKLLKTQNIYNSGVSGNTSIQICNRIRQFDFTNYNAVILAGGVNDWLNGVATIGSLQPIGSAFNTNSLYGAWQSAIEYLMTSYPDTMIYVLIPAIAWNGNNVLTEEYAYVKKYVAELYNLPYLDLYKEGGITTINRDTFYADDVDTTGWRLHFNDKGNKLIGEKIAQFVNNH